MFERHEEGDRLAIRFSSGQGLVQKALGAAKAFMMGRGTTSELPLKVLAELLRNGETHGNRNDGAKTVTCKVEKTPEGRFWLRVADEGDGFDPFSLSEMALGEGGGSLTHGFGLINALADLVEFHQGGRQVSALVSGRKDKKMKVRNDGGWKVVDPSGCLDRDAADALRKTLADLMGEAPLKLKINMAQVNDMDVYGLSFLSALAGLKNELKDLNISLADPQQDVANLLGATRLDESLCFLGAPWKSI